MSSLRHHGIKGQRWGVRRFQNKDGTRTAAGKKQEKLKRLKKTSKDYASIKESLSDDDLKFLNYDDDDIKRARELGTLGRDLVDSGRVAHRVIQKDKNGTPVTYVDANWMLTTSLLTGKNTTKLISIDLATRAGEEYRGKGYAVAAGKKMVKWFDTYGYKDYEYMEWGAKEKNIASQKTAEKLGFKKYEGTTAPGWIIYTYEHKAQHTSIGGTMYIEGNALILGDSSYLEHHGILGQKWGVRRFQNKDGTLTREGQIRFAKKNLKHAKVRNLDKWGKSPDSNVLYIIGTSGSGKSTTAKGLAEDGDQVIHLDTIFEKENHGSPDSNKDFEAFLKENNVDITKASDFSIPKEERWQIYDAMGDLVEAYGQHCFTKGSKVVIEGVQMGDQTLYPDKNYFNGKPTVVLKGNIVRDTFRADRRDGVPLRKTVVRLTDKERWNWYKQVNATSNEIKYTSIGGTMYIEGNALILGDSSYLEHHGIRGQRWGVRRFQNKDGSLTNAGRKRLGYATKGAAQTVGKAFKAGVKAGGNAVKAVKAHHEKKEAEKLEKKKEKASKTRLGVMANKDLFTNEEIRKLNERFKLEDEMKMATLQKGVEIAKAVGTIAQNVGTVAKTYEDVTGQSLSPIKRKAAEEKAKQDKEDRERRIAREDADEARKAAKEERDIAIHEQTLRKAIAAADTQEFTAQKTKAEADSSVLDAIKKGQDFNGGSDATGQSWMEKAKNGGKNPFDDMIANRDPEYAQIRKEHDEKVARKERIAELERREKEREAEKAAAASRHSAPQQKQGGGDDDALFSQKGSLPIDKDRYRNNRAMEKAKQVKEDAAEERAKKQDEKAAKATIDDMMEARRQFTDSARANSNGAFDRETAANYIKGKAKELPSKLNPINAISKKITDKALKEEEAASRKAMEDEYKKASRSQGRDEANYTMYYNRVNALQAQGYSERQAKKVADTESPFSSKRNRRFEYNEKVGEIESTHRKNAKEINKANKELTDYYYKLVNGPGYEPGSPKREALDRKYAQKRGELERLEKDNNDMLDKEKKKAKKILEHSFSIQNGVLFINAGEPYLEHHGVKGMKWGKHLMAGKGEAGAGGGSGEDDEKLKEMAKKAGMSVAEYRTKMASKLSGAAAKAKKEIGYAYGSEYKKDFEKAARLHENNSKSMHAQAKAAWEGYGESRTAAQKDNWKRYAEYDRQAKASGNMFVKRERSKQAYDNSLASKVDSVKRKARLTQDKAKSKISDAVDAAKKTKDDVKSNIRSKTGIGVKKDIERNARLAEGQKRRAHELTKQVYSAKSKEDWARAYDESNKESSKAWDNEHRVKKDTKSYPKSIAGRVDSAKRKARLTKDSLKSALGKSKQRKQLTIEGPKAKKRVATAGRKVNGNLPQSVLNPKHTDTSHRRKSVGEVMNNAKNPTPGSTPIPSPTQYTHTNRPRGREKYFKLGQESKGVKKRRRRAKHLDDTNAIYTEGTRLVVNSKWG